METEAQSQQVDINRLETALSRLRIKQDLTLQDLDSHKSVFSPIRRLPEDIILRIFIGLDYCRVSTDLKQSPWLFGHVCHHWRVLTRSSPSLWASLCVNLASPPPHNLLTIFLSLSKNVPLDIILDAREIGDEGKEVLHNSIIPLSRRWFDLTLLVTNDTVFKFLPITDRLPILKFLHITVFPGVEPSQSTGSLAHMFLSAPLLRSAAIFATHPQALDIALPLSQIINLCLVNFPWTFSHLTMATALESFTVHCPIPSVPDDDVSSQSLIHENISCLSFPVAIPSAIREWSMPNLETLELYCMLMHSPLSAPEVEISHIIQFARRSRLRLRSLRIFRPVRASILRDLLRHLSSRLSGLVITVDGATGSELFRELGSSSAMPFQNVRQLTLRISGRQVFSLFEDDTLVRLVSSMHHQSLHRLVIKCRSSQEMPDRPDVMERLTFLRALKQQGLLASLTIEGIDFLGDDDRFDSIYRHSGHAALLSQ
ncbi:hypothetical protein IW261DRAFT_1611672 [Armillaria novae-zelandiae]|uniref:F-box domain-containing protein n=1 Tax=Armillaria novae-zelandiae TaxID=153914 RepID=A0AA39NVL3_9AGAR|nr:hypothetical protein IW261DRAFT_1611672 [Armillaria novae-zelandiae]